MSDVLQPLARSAAWPSFTTTSTGSAAVRVIPRDELGIATMIASRGGGAALAERIHKLFGVELPGGPRRVPEGPAAFTGVGPGVWLVTREGEAVDDFAESLAREVGDIAAVSDQSDALAVLRISGPRVRAALCKLLPVDLHPRAFSIGDAAVTTAAHIGVTLWRLQDDPADSSVFELAVPRSMAESFWEALSAAAAEFGIEVRQMP